MYLVLIAGGIASGKSSVARMLEGFGATRIDLDELTHEVSAAGSETLEEIALQFGSDVLAPDGSLRRDVLAGRAFADDESCARLEAIVHPAVLALLRLRLASAEADEVVFVEVPLLDRVEALIEMADEVVCVVCPLEVRARRAVLRGMDEDDFYARVRRQPTDDYLIARADTVFDNAGSASDLERMVTDWYESLMKKILRGRE